jgi:hypothetical protein
MVEAENKNYSVGPRLVAQLSAVPLVDIARRGLERRAQHGAIEEPTTLDHNAQSGGLCAWVILSTLLAIPRNHD